MTEPYRRLFWKSVCLSCDWWMCRFMFWKAGVFWSTSVQSHLIWFIKASIGDRRTSVSCHQNVKKKSDSLDKRPTCNVTVQLKTCLGRLTFVFHLQNNLMSLLKGKRLMWLCFTASGSFPPGGSTETRYYNVKGENQANCSCFDMLLTKKKKTQLILKYY